MTFLNRGGDATITVKDKKDDNTLFSDLVKSAHTFSFTGPPGNGDMGTEITVFVSGLPSFKIHTSCSDPIYTGLYFEEIFLEIVDGASRNGGRFCDFWIAKSGKGSARRLAQGDCACAGGMTSISMVNYGDDAKIEIYDKGYQNSLFSKEVPSGHIFTFEKHKNAKTMGKRIEIDVASRGHLTINMNCASVPPMGATFSKVELQIISGVRAKSGVICDGNSFGCDCNGCVCPFRASSTTLGVQCGACEGKLSSLTLLNRGVGATITVKDKKDQNTLFSEFVDSDHKFSFTGPAGRDDMGTQITVYVSGMDPFQIHTSCSKPIYIGLYFGDIFLEIVDGASREGGQLCYGEGASPSQSSSGSFSSSSSDSADLDACGCPRDVVLHTSCSEPIFIGLSLPTLSLVIIDGESLKNGQLCVANETSSISCDCEG
ncbi:MAG: hypothetical protein GY940_16035, partial [bacterium]|nr:hypothetical protein [bacterium]